MNIPGNYFEKLREDLWDGLVHMEAWHFNNLYHYWRENEGYWQLICFIKGHIIWTIKWTSVKLRMREGMLYLNDKEDIQPAFTTNYYQTLS
jgi:hypothetical protein